MKKQSSNTFRSIALLFFVTFSSPPVFAALTVDTPNFGAQVSETIGNVISWGKEKSIMIADMDLQSLLSKFNIDGMNSGFANLMARTGRMYQEIQNNELMEKLLPDADICGNVSYSLHSENVGCSMDEQARDRTYDAVSDNLRFGLKGDEFNKYAKAKVSKTIETCKSITLIDGKELETAAEKLQYSDCFQVGKLNGGGISGSTLTVNESEAMDKAIEIMAGAVPTKKASASMKEGSVIYNITVLQEGRKENLRSLAIASQHEVKKWYAPVEKSDGKTEPSEMAGLDGWVSERGAGWVMRVGGGTLKEDANGNPVPKPTAEEDTKAYPPELARKSLEIDRWTAVLQLEQFKSQLRRESLSAAMLSLMVEPI
jgi:hypothetical protein